MATYTPRRLQRSQKNPQLSYRQFLVFTIANEQFALPIESIYKVIQTPQVYGDPNHRGFGLITYQGEQIVVIDVEQHLFGRSQLLESPSKNKLEAARFLILMRVEQSDRSSQIIALPVEQAPQLQRLPQQTITSLPDSYLRWGDIHGVTSVSVQDLEVPDEHPTFILEPSAVLATLANTEVIAPAEPRPAALASAQAIVPNADEVTDAIINPLPEPDLSEPESDLDSASVTDLLTTEDLDETLETVLEEASAVLEAVDSESSLPISEPALVTENGGNSVFLAEDAADFLLTEEEDVVEADQEAAITTKASTKSPDSSPITSEESEEIPDLDDLPDLELPDLDLDEVEELFSAVDEEDLDLDP